MRGIVGEEKVGIMRYFLGMVNFRNFLEIFNVFGL